MPVILKFWIVGSALCVLTGWLLSAVKQLNPPGYSVAFCVMAAAFWAFVRQERRAGQRRSFDAAVFVHRAKKRFRRRQPGLFLVTAILTGIGGVLYPPNNYDALAYRLPRVLHWLSGQGWHWVSTPTMQVNYSGTVYEWLMAPLLLLSHGERLLFLIDWISYLFLPGLVFCVFAGCGISRRVAWKWMWMLPMGFCYVMQAASICNDLLGAAYVLAAMAFGLRAARRATVRDLWLGLLAAGLATGVKASNLPLLLPFVWAAAPAWKLARSRIVPTLGAIALALSVSFLPTAILNWRYAGSWTGDAQNHQRFQASNPLIGIVGGAMEITGQSFQPPVIPFAHQVEHWIRGLFPASLRDALARDFPSFGFALNELPQEEASAMGLAMTLVVLLSLAAAIIVSGRGTRKPGHSVEWRQGAIVGVLAWVALLVFMANLSLDAIGRLLSPYYALLLIPLLLHRSQELLVRKTIWNGMAVFVAVAAWVPVVLTPSRPLWPGVQAFDWLARRYPASSEVARGQLVYRIYAKRNDVFASLYRRIPDSVTRIGVIQSPMNPETSFWRPFGHREVVNFRGDDLQFGPPEEWMIIDREMVQTPGNQPINQWIAGLGGDIVAEESIRVTTASPVETWYVVHFKAASTSRKPLTEFDPGKPH